MTTAEFNGYAEALNTRLSDAGDNVPRPEQPEKPIRLVIYGNGDGKLADQINDHPNYRIVSHTTCWCWMGNYEDSSLNETIIMEREK